MRTLYPPTDPPFLCCSRRPNTSILPRSGPVALRQDVGVVLDHTYLVGEWRLSEVERAVGPFYDRWDTKRYHDLLDEFGLDARARVKDLSRGMAVKLMITIALSHRARLLVFDGQAVLARQ